MALAIATHIPIGDWLAAGDTAIATAFEILEKQAAELEANKKG